MIKTLYFYLTILVSTSTALANVGEITVSQSISNNDVAYEDSILFEIQLQWVGPQSAYLFNKPLNPYIDRLKVAGFSSSISSAPNQNNQEITTKKYKFVLKPTNPGQGKIEETTINYLIWPDSIPGELLTEPVAINIAMPVKKAEPKESFPLWIIIVSVAVGILILIFSYFKIKASKEPKEIIKTPKEDFLDNLTVLKQNTGTDLKIFQTGFYKLCLDYLNKEFNIDMTEFQPSLFVEKMKDTKLSNQQIDQIVKWMEQANKDKYSPIASTPGDTIRQESAVRDFFEKM